MDAIFFTRHQVVQKKLKLKSTLLLLFVWNGDGAFTESVAEPPADDTEMPQATSTSCVSPQRLDTPAVATHLGSGISTGSTGFFLDVHAHTAATTAQRVSLITTFTKRAGSLSLKSQLKNQLKTVLLLLTCWIGEFKILKSTTKPQNNVWIEKYRKVEKVWNHTNGLFMYSTSLCSKTPPRLDYLAPASEDVGGTYLAIFAYGT
jgi:hypothetical protein